LTNGIIELKQTGFQTTESVVEFQSRIDDLVKNYKAEGKAALILVDLSEVTGHESEARRLATKRLKDDFTAIAIFGGLNQAMRLIINWVIHTIGNDPRVQFFENREQAEAWLLEHQRTDAV